MRRPARPALALLMLVVLAGCGEQTEPPAADGPSPSVATSSEVPGTRPSPTEFSSAQAPRTSTPAQESLIPRASPTPISTESIPATPGTLAGYQALMTGLTALFAKIETLERGDRDVDPKDADDLERLVGDVFPEGVELDVFSLGEVGLIMCLTGPAATFVVLGPEGDGIRQVLGRGDCTDPQSIDAEADGDVVVDVTVDLVGDPPKAQYVATVMKGQNLAEQIPGIDDFIDGLNAAVAG